MRVTRAVAGSAIAVAGSLGIVLGLDAVHLPSLVGASSPDPVATSSVSPVASPQAAPAAVAPPAVFPTTTTAAPPTTTTTTRPTTTTPSSTARAASGLPCSGITGDGACVSLSSKKAWLIRDGEVVLSGSITSGKPGERTPTGSFHVQWKDADHLSKEFDDAPMPWSVFFNGGIAFHTGSLSRQSAGCVHLSDSVARTFYRTLQVGDPVIVVK